MFFWWQIFTFHICLLVSRHHFIFFLFSGGWDADGRGPCVWDTFTHQGGERVFENQTGDVACGSYTLWEEDLKCIKQLGLTHYRFSLSWSRLLPDGTTGFINQKGKCFLKIEGCSFNSRLLLQSGIINPACCSAGQLWKSQVFRVIIG